MGWPDGYERHGRLEELEHVLRHCPARDKLPPWVRHENFSARGFVDAVERFVSWHASGQPQDLPFSNCTPSLAMMGTIASAAAGSAHHQPKSAFISKPVNRLSEIAHNKVLDHH